MRFGDLNGFLLSQLLHLEDLVLLCGIPNCKIVCQFASLALQGHFSLHLGHLSVAFIVNRCSVETVTGATVRVQDVAA
jgi:hypothetical protein